MPTLTLGDDDKTVSLTISAVGVGIEDVEIVDFMSALDSVNNLIPISTIVLATGTYVTTLKDARVYTVDVTPGTPPVFRFTSTSFWNQAEHSVLQSLGASINALMLLHGLSAAAVTYA